MSIIAPKPQTKEYQIVPSGTHIATCYSMIHIGTIEEEYMGESKLNNKVRLSFEIPAEIIDVDGVDMPMSIQKEYNLSMYEKSNLRKDLESWRGKGFTNDEADNFDITKLLGVPCMISVVHKTSKKGTEYAVISTISPLMKGTQAPEQFNQPFQFNYNDNFDIDWLNTQSEWLSERIKSSKEYRAKTDEHTGIAGVDKAIDDMPF